MKAEPNEGTRRPTGEKVPYAGDYKTACCATVQPFELDQSFPPCPQHGDTDWNWIPPFGAIVNLDFGQGALIEHAKRTQKVHQVVASSTMSLESRFAAEVEPRVVNPELPQSAILVFQDERDDSLRIREVSILGDYVQRTDSGLLVPRRAFLVHLKDYFGAFTLDEIGELEELVNNPKAEEADFQKFFEDHPRIFNRWDYHQVHSHVYLTRDDDGPLVPDFILTDPALQRSAVIDLKLPTAKLVRRQKNRYRFASAVAEARSQLLRYRDWFRVPENRRGLKEKVDMEIYEPHLGMIIGRSEEFMDGIDRQQLAADMSDVEIVTYDDILAFAKRRRLIFEGTCRVR